ncbi:MAG: hypothetical protein M5R36_20920 [Deltaproteobacteria bacterium]|nr:hypothetical protein [Deltaproteobacteria bacterium]
MAALALVLRDVVSLERLTGIGGRLVGASLIGVGLWGLHRAFSKRLHMHEHTHGPERHAHIHLHDRDGHAAGHGAHAGHAHAAVGVGILHGLAGGSHVVGVLPALILPSRLAALCYLVTYGVATVATMSVFTWGLQRIADRWLLSKLSVYRATLASLAGIACVVGAVFLI